MTKVHFIGFKGDEYLSALRVWGRPDFVHAKATWSLLGSIPAEDTVVFGPHAFSKRRVPVAHGGRPSRTRPNNLEETMP